MENKVINYLKHEGFLIPNAEIYNRLANSWDLGPFGVELKNNIKKIWWKFFVTSEPQNIGFDSLITTHPEVLKNSGHLDNFFDLFTKCMNCAKKFRIDHLFTSSESKINLSNSQEEIKKFTCPNCGQRTLNEVDKVDLIFSLNNKGFQGSSETIYLRPETCQGIFVNFSNIERSTNKKIPFGVGQIGKSFRNEITLNRGIFRTREFEQMELEFFCHPSEVEIWWNYWLGQGWSFLNKFINEKENIKKVELRKDELPHYARKTTDFYYKYHFGWGELCSNSDRINDLKNHNQSSKFSKEIPEVVEVSFGVERLMLALLEDAYKEEIIIEKKPRTYLKLNPLLSPYFATIIPLKKEFNKEAFNIYQNLIKRVNFNLGYEQAPNIGKSYRRQDAIGTFYCLTIDENTINKQTLTIRERDSMKQIVLSNNEVEGFLNEKYSNFSRDFLLI